MQKRLPSLFASPNPSISPVMRHALSSPITSIELELEELGLIEEQSTSLSEAIDCVKSWINQHQQPQRFAVQQAIKKSCAIVQTQYPNSSISLCCDEQPIWLFGHAHLFQEVVACLVSNACEAYSQHAGPVSVCLSRINHSWSLTVSDQGRGMNWWQQRICWLPNTTFKSHGTGIGLWFVRWQIQQLNGRLLLWSRPNHGTRIQLVFPESVNK